MHTNYHFSHSLQSKSSSAETCCNPSPLFEVSHSIIHPAIFKRVAEVYGVFPPLSPHPTPGEKGNNGTQFVHPTHANYCGWPWYEATCIYNAHSRVTHVLYGYTSLIAALYTAYNSKPYIHTDNRQPDDVTGTSHHNKLTSALHSLMPFLISE